MGLVEFFLGGSKPDPDARASRADSVKSRAEFPRLSIGDLLLLTLILGSALAWLSPYIRLLNQPQYQGQIAPLLARYTVLAVTLFGLILIVRHSWRGARWRLEPGHWYFIATAILVLDSFLSEAEQLIINDAGRTASLQIAYHGIATITYLIVGSIAVRAAMAVKHWQWRACLGLLAASGYVMALSCALGLAQKLGVSIDYSFWYNVGVVQANLDFAFGLATLAAVAIDLRQGIRRDWLHYLAVAAIVLTTAALFDTSSSPLVDWWTRLFRRVMG